MVKKPKILVVSQYFYPEQFRINDICLEWIKKGYEVTVLTGIPNYPEGKFFEGYGLCKKRQETWKGIKIIRLPIIPRGKTAKQLILNYYSFVISGFFWSMFTNIKTDCVFTFGLSPMTQAKVGCWYSKRRNIPHYLYVQDLWPDSLEVVGGIHNKFVLNHYAEMSKKIYSQCRNVFVTSPSFVEALRPQVNDNPEKVVYWPQYAEDFYKPIPRKEIPEIPSDGKFKVVFTGNIGRAQGLDSLPKAALSLKKKGAEDVTFVVVGNGRYKETLISKINESGVSSMFIFVDRQPAERIPEILAACDVAFISFMSNSLFEKTIPAKLQSYLACGMPIVALAAGETERILKEADCGVCFGFDEAEEMAQGIIEMKEKADLHRMSQNALKYSKENFEKNKLITQLDSYFNTECPINSGTV